MVHLADDTAKNEASRKIEPGDWRMVTILNREIYELLTKKPAPNQTWKWQNITRNTVFRKEKKKKEKESGKTGNHGEECLEGPADAEALRWKQQKK